MFHVSGAQAVGHSTTSIVTLRAATASAKEAWLAQLRAAVAGSNAEEPAKPVAAVLHRASTGGSEEAEGGVAAQGSVPRKISTAVFAEEPPAAAAAGEEEVGQADSANGVQEEDEASEASDDPEAAAAAQLAAEEALVADIAAQAAQRSLRPGEQAVLQAALKVRAGLILKSGMGETGSLEGREMCAKVTSHRTHSTIPLLPPAPRPSRAMCMPPAVACCVRLTRRSAPTCCWAGGRRWTKRCWRWCCRQGWLHLAPMLTTAAYSFASLSGVPACPEKRHAGLWGGVSGHVSPFQSRMLSVKQFASSHWESA